MLALGQATPFSWLVVPEVRVDHVEPPLVVATITPVVPAAQQLLESLQAIPRSVAEVLATCAVLVQPAPLLEVLVTVPLAPAAKHVLALGQEIAWSAWVVPEGCWFQLEPPFVLAEIVPPACAA